MARLSTHTPTELAHRSSDGEDKVDVRVCDKRERAYFEIPAQPHLGLDVYYHPFACRHFSAVEHEDSRLAA
jgi:hypothetical protein